MSIFIKLYWYLVNLFFPAECLICGKEDDLACQNCLKKVDLRICFQENFVFLDALYYFAEYKTESILIKALWEWKYNLNLEARKIIFSLIWPVLKNNKVLMGLINDSHSIITFVPASSEKYKFRGFNQAKDISACLSGGKARPHLIKIAQKNVQMGLNAKDRIINTFGNYQLANNVEVSGKTVLVFDDVCTTGATLEELAKILKEAGAAAVCGVVLARKL